MQIIEEAVGDVTRNCKNYATEGGDRLVIGGTLEILDTATVTGLQSGYASTDQAGSVYQSSNQAESAATTIADLKSDFNALLLKLKDAGIMAADEVGSS